MTLSLAAVGLLLISGAAALFFRQKPRLATTLASSGAVGSSVLGIIPVLQTLLGGPTVHVSLPWSLPLGGLSLELDPLSAFFLLPIHLLSALCAVYGHEYLKDYETRYSTGAAAALANGLVACMAVVCLARNALLFLVAWEGMALTSFLLVAFQNDKEESRRSSWIYFISTHLGTACLLPMFLILGKGGVDLDFGHFALSPDSVAVPICLILALIGFGTKAGLIPFHVWLPEAHPAAPSHVSALMSGVMIKTGIYGLLRILTFLGSPQPWWGWLFIILGAISGVVGVLFALAQHDLKRMLAYHSIENIGIIVMGIGLGVLGTALHEPSMAVLGFSGGLLHVLNHSVFKGLLFLGAGSIAHGAKTRELDLLGGLYRKMPWTGLTFLIGSVAISGLPPFNGFVSEFIIYMAAFGGAASPDTLSALPSIGIILALALIGGLALACFAKAFGVIFLGHPRSGKVETARESKALMWIPMAVLALICIVIGIAAPQALLLVREPVLSLAPASPQSSGFLLPALLAPFSLAASALIIVAGALALLRRTLLSRQTIGKTVTWDCGYAAPSARMQFTASSFAQPIIELFGMFLKTEKTFRMKPDYFPTRASFETHTPDTYQERVYRPLMTGLAALLKKVEILQRGRIQLYILYMVMTLLGLMLWKL